ncbi:hypothetical protein BMT54_09665 [Pasteurellaceae bacterium 15-036681]|nr:hypothetical protein BMT54_09665 [Pasteurellaceae bacterium 15-036681]
MKKALSVAVLTLLVAGCSVRSPEGSLEHWKNYGSESFSTSELSDKQALAVFYRQAEVSGPAVNVYVNSDYHGSLLNDSYKAIPVCATNQVFSASYTTNQKFGNRTQGVSYTLPSKEVAFIKVALDSKGQPTFTRVSEEVAKAEIANLKGKATQTLSRVVTDKDCNNPVLFAGQFSAGALWGIDRHSYKDMLPKGKQEIAEFADKIKQIDPAKIDRIELSGHTDPEASDAYNNALSQKRANTVKQALQKAGVTLPIKAVGYGETNLLAANCRELHPTNKKARAECDLPNRRVEVAVYGK